MIWWKISWRKARARERRKLSRAFISRRLEDDERQMTAGDFERLF
jgi:hypothetical protein